MNVTIGSLYMYMYCYTYCTVKLISVCILTYCSV